MTEFGHVLRGLEPWLHQYGVVAVFVILTFELLGLEAVAHRLRFLGTVFVSIALIVILTYAY